MALFDILGFFSDIGFVIKIMALAYLIFWLYLTFRESQFLFGVAAIVASYFMLTSAIPTILLIVAFLVFVVMGNQLQMLLLFGVFPLARFVGIELEPDRVAAMEAQKAEQAMAKAQQGMALSMEEQKLLERQMGQGMGAGGYASAIQHNQLQRLAAAR